MFIIKSIINDDRETSIIEAPTGSGKSLLCIISAGVLLKYYNKKSYILCSDLYLWQQYVDIIESKKLNNYGYLKGSIGNYTCFMNKQDLSCARCKLEKISYTQLKDKKWRTQNFYNCVDKCIYMQQRFRAEKSPISVLTYQLWLYHMNLVNKNNKEENIQTFPVRDVIFCDECHNIPDIIQQFCSVTINTEKDINKIMSIFDYISEINLNNLNNLNSIDYNENIMKDDYIINYYNKTNNNKTNKLHYNDIFDNDKIKKYLKLLYIALYNNQENPDQLIDILILYIDILNYLNYMSDMILEQMQESLFNTKKLDKETENIVKKLNWFSTYFLNIKNYKESIINSGTEYMLMDIITDEETKNETYSFMCAKEDFLCNEYFLKHIKNKILLSATVGLHHAFDDNIGIKYTVQKMSYMSKIPSTFNYDKSPIYFIPTYKMNYANKKQDFPKIQALTIKIINANINQKGIIHTGSYENARFFYNNAPYEIRQRLYLYGNSKQKEESISNFKNSKNGILIGPTLIDGIDLPNDYCRFIIIMKIPYPNITNKIVKKKIELFPDWYNNTTSNMIIQSIGRGVRNENDYCNTYILDGCFGQLYQQTKEQYPEHIKNRLKIITA